LEIRKIRIIEIGTSFLSILSSAGKVHCSLEVGDSHTHRYYVLCSVYVDVYTSISSILACFLFET